MSSSPKPTGRSKGKAQEESSRTPSGSAATPTGNSALDVLISSLRPLAERDPEKHKRIEALKAALQAIEACTDESHVSPYDPAEGKPPAEEHRKRAEAKAQRWFERWILAVEALRSVPGVDVETIIDVPRPHRIRPAPAVMARAASVKALFLELVRDPIGSRDHLLKELARLFEADPDSFPAQAWFFGAVMFELHLMVNELKLTDDERGLRESVLKESKNGAHLKPNELVPSPELSARSPRPDLTMSQPTHAPDFTWIVVQGTRYEFSQGQRASTIQQLWSAWEKSGCIDGSGMSQSMIATELEAGTDFRVSKLFARHPALGRVICVTGKGRWGLFLNSPKTPGADPRKTPG